MHLPLWLAKARFRTAVHLFRYWRTYLLAAVLMAVVLPVLALLPPANFPTGEIVRIEEDVPLLRQAERLEREGVLSSSFIFSAGMRLLSLDDNVKSGAYVFDRPLGVIGVAQRFIRGEFGLKETRVTLTEGMTTREMADRLAEALPSFDRQEFLRLARPQEGYLFPDTYFFMPDVTVSEVVMRMRSNFDVHIEEATDVIEAQEASLEELVIMASLLEKEARTMEVRRTVAGILWNRIELGMPLQVDAVFGYIHDRPTYSPSFDDLESDSPYNTYRFEGLPPGPINNPGIDAIIAAATPVETDYLYYLTDADGNIHYARTFDEHRRNRELYLD